MENKYKELLLDILNNIYKGISSIADYLKNDNHIDLQNSSKIHSFIIEWYKHYFNYLDLLRRDDEIRNLTEDNYKKLNPNICPWNNKGKLMNIAIRDIDIQLDKICFNLHINKNDD